MPTAVQELPISPELMESIIADIDDRAEKSAARQIIRRFDEAGLTIKVKHLFASEPCAYYRIQCFIKKSRDTVLINTKKDHGRKNIVGGMNLQVRMDNRSSLHNLDAFSDNIRNQILNANNCVNCTAKCEGKQYAFSFGGKEYQKCHFICSNFRFAAIKEDDIASLLAIINGEIEYKQKPSRKA